MSRDIIITSEIGAGEYVGKRVNNNGGLQTAITVLEAKITELDLKITEAETAVTDAETAKADAQSAADAALLAFKIASEADPEGNLEGVTDAVNAAVIALSIAASELTSAEYGLSSYENAKIAAQMEIDRLQAFIDDDLAAVTIWCADYTEDLSGTVPALQIAGDSDNLIIAPGGVNTDQGSFVQVGSQSAHATVFNYYMEDWATKYKPRYRIATITSIDYDLDTATVILDAVTGKNGSSLNNGYHTLSDVSVEYMACNASAFIIDDRVAIQFTDQDWEQPVIIGFETEPEMCQTLYTFYDSNLRRHNQFSSEILATLPGWEEEQEKFDVDSNGDIIASYYPGFYSSPVVYVKYDGFSTSIVETINATNDLATPGWTPYTAYYPSRTTAADGLNLVTSFWEISGVTWQQKVSRCDGFSTDITDTFIRPDYDSVGDYGFWGGCDCVEDNFIGCTESQDFSGSWAIYYAVKKFSGFTDSVAQTLRAPDWDYITNIDHDKFDNLIYTLMHYTGYSLTSSTVYLCDGFSLSVLNSVSLVDWGSAAWG